MTDETGPTRAPTPLVRSIPPKVAQRTPLPARAGGELAVRPSLMPQPNGGALLSGGIPGHPGRNQHTTRKQADDVRGKLLTQLEGVAEDLEKLLEEARANDGKQPKCPQCGGFIPGVSKLTLKDTLMALRELRAVLPAQLEHEGGLPISVTVVGGVQIVPNRPVEE